MDGGKKQTSRETGRGERIRTSGLYVPNVALYQAKLHPAVFFVGQKLLQKLLLTAKSANCIKADLCFESGKASRARFAMSVSRCACSRVYCKEPVS